jgi:hypothetical protein
MRVDEGDKEVEGFGSVGTTLVPERREKKKKCDRNRDN